MTALTMVLPVLLAPFVHVDPGAPSGCPDAVAIEREIEAQVGDGLPDETARVAVAYLSDGDALAARVTVARAGHSPIVRSIPGLASDCGALADAVAFTAALMLDDVDAPPVEQATPPSGASLTWQLHLGLQGDTGPLPGGAIGSEFGARLGGDGWRAGVALRVDLALPDAVSIGVVDGHLIGGVASACAGARAVLCVAGMLGSQRLDGRGFAVDHSVASRYGAAGLRGEYGWRVGDWRVAAVASVWIPVTRLHLTVSGVRTWQTSAVVGGLGLDLARFF